MNMRKLTGNAAILGAGICVAAAMTSWAAATTPPAILVDLTTDNAGGAVQWSARYPNNNNYLGPKAFDNGRYYNAVGTVDGSRWLAAYNTTGMYIIYKFKVATAVDAIGVFLPQSGGGKYGERAPRDWTFSGSNDNATWTVLDTQTGETDWSSGEVRYYKFTNRTKYLYYKFNCTANNGATDAMQILELEFYDSTGALPSEHFEDLTTDGAGSVTSYSTRYSSNTYIGTKAFDNGSGNTATSQSDSRWLAAYDTSGMYVIYKFNAPTVVDGLGIMLPASGGGYYNTRAPNSWTLLGSNDTSTAWTVLDSRTGETGWTQGEFRNYTFNNSEAYQYYKFNCTANNGATDCLQILELEFYNHDNVPINATWSGRGETISLADAGNWYPARPGAITSVNIGGTGDGYAVVPAGTTTYVGMYLGNWTNATVRQTQGTLNVSEFTFGRNPRGYGRYEITGGELNATSGVCYLGAYGGNGALDISGDGSVNIQNELRISHSGSEAPSFGSLAVSGNGSLSVSNHLIVAFSDNAATTGEFVQTGGACTVDKWIVVGWGAASTGRYEMTGGTCTALLISVGRYGNGTLVVSGPDTILTAADGVRVGLSNSGNNGVGTVVVTNGGTIAVGSIYNAGNSANQAFVTFDGGVVRAMDDNVSFLRNLANIDLKAGGLAIESDGHDLGISGCTFNVTPDAKISVTGGGEMTFTDTTVNLAERPRRGFTLAETDGTFSGLPAFSGPRGWKMRLSDDAKRIRILPPGFMMIVR